MSWLQALFVIAFRMKIFHAPSFQLHEAAVSLGKEHGGGQGLVKSYKCGMSALVGDVQCKLVSVACVSVLLVVHVSLWSRLSRADDDLCEEENKLWNIINTLNNFLSYKK